MAIFMDKSSCLVIDRSIPEILKVNNYFAGETLISYCRLLNKIGVDLLEINQTALRKMIKLPQKLDFIFRVENEQELQLYSPENNIKFLLLKPEICLGKYYQETKEKYKNCKIILELNADNTSDFGQLVELSNFTDQNNIHAIRIQGLDSSFGESWENIIQTIRDRFNVKLDICLKNDYYLATSLNVDLLGNKEEIQYLTTCFTGMGGFAPLEEILMAAKVILDLNVAGDPTLFPILKKLLIAMTAEEVRGDKPIIGSHIFKYESGIHADGIKKNPQTYEPFEPVMVGQERKLLLGKHSGLNSLITKLQELDIHYKTGELLIILEKIKEMSIDLKREIYDEELRQICWEIGIKSQVNSKRDKYGCKSNRYYIA